MSKNGLIYISEELLKIEQKSTIYISEVWCKMD